MAGWIPDMDRNGYIYHLSYLILSYPIPSILYIYIYIYIIICIYILYYIMTYGLCYGIWFLTISFPHRPSPNFWGGASAGRRWKIKRSPFKSFFGSKRSQIIIEHKEPQRTKNSVWTSPSNYFFWGDVVQILKQNSDILGATSLESLNFPTAVRLLPSPRVPAPPGSCVNGIGLMGGPCSLALPSFVWK